MTWLVTALSFVVMFGATAYVLRANWPAGGYPFLAWQAHAGAILALCIELGTRALKIQASAHSIDVPLSFTAALRVCLAGDFAAAVTPARSGAEPARYLVLAESRVGAGDSVVILFLELFLEMLSLALVCVFLALFFSGSGTSAVGLLALVGGYSSFVLAVGIAGWLLSRRSDGATLPRWLPVWWLSVTWRAKLKHGIAEFGISVKALKTAHVRYLLAAFAGSVVHVLCKVAALPLLVYLSAPDFPLTRDTLAPLVLWPLALFYGGVVVPAPGGGGFIEGAFAVTLKDSIPPAVFAASLIWWRFYTFYLYIVVGGIAAGDSAMRAIRSRGATPETTE